MVDTQHISIFYISSHFIDAIMRGVWYCQLCSYTTLITCCVSIWQGRRALLGATPTPPTDGWTPRDDRYPAIILRPLTREPLATTGTRPSFSAHWRVNPSRRQVPGHHSPPVQTKYAFVLFCCCKQTYLWTQLLRRFSIDVAVGTTSMNYTTFILIKSIPCIC